MRRKQIAKKLASKGISVVENEFSVVLFGETDSWSEKVWAGALAARFEGDGEAALTPALYVVRADSRVAMVQVR